MGRFLRAKSSGSHTIFFSASHPSSTQLSERTSSPNTNKIWLSSQLKFAVITHQVFPQNNIGPQIIFGWYKFGTSLGWKCRTWWNSNCEECLCIFLITKTKYHFWMLHNVSLYGVNLIFLVCWMLLCSQREGKKLNRENICQKEALSSGEAGRPFLKGRGENGIFHLEPTSTC